MKKKFTQMRQRIQEKKRHQKYVTSVAVDTHYMMYVFCVTAHHQITIKCEK